MRSSQPFERWSNVEVFPKDEDFEVLSFPTQPLRLDFSGSSGYADDAAADAAAADIDHQLDEPPTQESAFDYLPMDSFVYDPYYSLLDFEPSPSMLQVSGGNFCSGFVDEYKAWNHHHHQEMMHFEFNMDEENKPLLLCDGSSKGVITSVEECPAGKKSRKRRECNSSSSTLSRQTISKYFYMPITQAAKELNIGLTLLKKRCRELGIRRWPHRKLMSLQTLIKNVQEMQDGVGGNMAESKLRETINILENEKKLMEEIPDLQLEGQTKRLRQACFKANYKKRKLVGVMEYQASLNNADSIAANNSEDQQEEYCNDEEKDLDSIFADCLSSSDSDNMSNVNNLYEL